MTTTPAQSGPLEIKVRITVQYGNERIFPVCEKAELFAAIAGSKTLTRHVVEHIKALGYTVSVVQENSTL